MKLPMKAWRAQEAQRTGRTESAIAMRLHRGQYQIKLEYLTVRQVNVIGQPKYKPNE